ncbi:hypothetical protein OIU78_029040 [Salix suchowensis]|nr:hypothetical protein OIU78_029040 [Salix suchowensis]
MASAESNSATHLHLLTLLLLTISLPNRSLSIRIPDHLKPCFGCLNGVVRTTVGYCGGSKLNPVYRSLGDHAESVQVEYDPKVISYTQLLEVFWASHDSRQVFGQGPDVGNQYRSVIFTNGTEERRLAGVSKEREQLKSRSSVVVTQIQQLGTFYPAEPEHQKFELKQSPFLRQLMGNLPEVDLENSSLAAKLNGYAAELCPPGIQKQIDAKINDILRKGIENPELWMAQANRQACRFVSFQPLQLNCWCLVGEEIPLPKAALPRNAYCCKLCHIVQDVPLFCCVLPTGMDNSSLSSSSLLYCEPGFKRVPWIISVTIDHESLNLLPPTQSAAISESQSIRFRFSGQIYCTDAKKSQRNNQHLFSRNKRKLNSLFQTSKVRNESDKFIDGRLVLEVKLENAM